jgi:hypothetical protein
MTIHEQLKTLELQVDAKFLTWTAWPTAMKEWHFQAEQEGAHFSINSTTISEAFIAALEWKPLPVVPRCPRQMYQGRFRLVKNGSKWRLLYDDQDCGVQVNTKREAAECVDKFCQRSTNAVSEWQHLYGWTASKTEGVDFRHA